MADPKAPDLFQRLLAFMRESDEWGTPADVLRSAEDAGLHICSEEEKRVLDASSELDQTTLEYWRDWGGDEDHDPLALYAEA